MAESRMQSGKLLAVIGDEVVSKALGIYETETALTCRTPALAFSSAESGR